MNRVRMTAIACALLVMLAVAGTGMGQALNMDFGYFYGLPTDVGGAVSGQLGLWNEIGPGMSFGLFDVDGAVTSVSVGVTAGSGDGSSPGCSVKRELLISDFAYTNTGTWTASFANLADGEYGLFIYAPSNSNVASGQLTINGSPYASFPGSSNCTFTSGVSYLETTVTVSGGGLTIIGDYTGSGVSYAGVAAVQLVPLAEVVFHDSFETGDAIRWSVSLE